MRILRLQQERYDTQQHKLLMDLLEVVQTGQDIVVVCGAGISTSANIPDFRSSTGAFVKYSNKQTGRSGKDVFDASVYNSGPGTSGFHDMVRDLATLCKDAKPTMFHRMLNEIASEGRLRRLYTQNIDGLDTQLEYLATSYPLDPDEPIPKCVQLHGSIHKMCCTSPVCFAVHDIDLELMSGPRLTECSDCLEARDAKRALDKRSEPVIGGMRPRITLYNEGGADDETLGLIWDKDLREAPGALIVAGTGLHIESVKRYVVRMAREMEKKWHSESVSKTRSTRQTAKKGLVIWINKDHYLMPPSAIAWDLVVFGEADAVAAQAGMGFQQGR